MLARLGQSWLSSLRVPVPYIWVIPCGASGASRRIVGPFLSAVVLGIHDGIPGGGGFQLP